MTIEKTTDGYWKIYTIHKGKFVKMLYGGMTKREAIKIFNDYLKTL